MKLNIQTAIRESDLWQERDKGYVIIESKYGWHCPVCNKYVEEFVKETFSIYREFHSTKTIINRQLQLHNDGQDWRCGACQNPEATKRRLIFKKFSL